MAEGLKKLIPLYKHLMLNEQNEEKERIKEFHDNYKEFYNTVQGKIEELKGLKENNNLTAESIRKVLDDRFFKKLLYQRNDHPIASIGSSLYSKNLHNFFYGDEDFLKALCTYMINANDVKSFAEFVQAWQERTRAYNLKYKANMNISWIVINRLAASCSFDVFKICSNNKFKKLLKWLYEQNIVSDINANNGNEFWFSNNNNLVKKIKPTHNSENEWLKNKQQQEEGSTIFNSYTIDEINIETDDFYINIFMDELSNNRNAFNAILEEYMNENIKKYTNLLKDNYNLILTGAPGTGKTYLARQIANSIIERGIDDESETEQIKQVQFHPSYDYTDFVEGLRPVKKSDNQKEIGFELKDGIFKDFCKEANEELKKLNGSIKKLLEAFIKYISNEIKENGQFEITGINNTTITPITDIDKRNFIVTPRDKDYTMYLEDIPKMYITFLKNQHINWKFDIVNREFGLSSRNGTYYYGFIKAFHQFIQETEDFDLNIKNYVFIIDEINRAEISKVFGELFFSIDPGYRGEKGRVLTQYNNLYNDNDVFKKGFYIPENVYIVGTMNDIDRSVESFDFAMRRRFVWEEIKAPSSTHDQMPIMWSSLSQDRQEEAKNRLINLNDAIANISELGTEFQVGPAYFLKLINDSYDFNQLWEQRLQPLLSEYVRGLPNKEDLLQNMQDAYENTNLSEAQNNSPENNTEADGAQE